MAETLVLRLEVDTGMYASFPENFKPYYDCVAVAGVGEFGVEEHNDEQGGVSGRPAMLTSRGVFVSSHVLHNDDFYIERLDKGMFVDNPVEQSDIDATLEDLLASTQQHHRLTRATFVGESTIGRLFELLEVSAGYNDHAKLVYDRAALAVNYASRRVQN